MTILVVTLLLWLLGVRPTRGFVPSLSNQKRFPKNVYEQLHNNQPSLRLHATPSTASSSRMCRARDLIQSLIQDENCYTTEAGARAFGEACAINVIYEDRFEPQPFVGKAVRIPSAC
jgi:hypothetical protein